jgi:uroporphyrinogen decarboxylase
MLMDMAFTGGDALGVDWRIPLDAAWDLANDYGKAVQGNLDPAVLLAPWGHVEMEAKLVLARALGRPGHVFNLGHGVLPQTTPDVLTRLTELVQSHIWAA